MDFAAGGANALEFCDPSNPRFIAVVARDSPVAMDLSPAAAEAGRPVAASIALRTATGKPIGPADLVASPSGGLQLLIADPSLEDFQAEPARPGRRAGEWTFAFAPRRAGIYRVFADFTPLATGREIYAYADLAVAGGPEAAVPGAAPGTAEAGGYLLALAIPGGPVRARQPFALVLTARPRDQQAPHDPKALKNTAALTIIDRNRAGFANLRSTAVRPPGTTGEGRRFTFTASVSDPGPYVAWSRLEVRGREAEVGLWFEAEP